MRAISIESWSRVNLKEGMIASALAEARRLSQRRLTRLRRFALAAGGMLLCFTIPGFLSFFGFIPHGVGAAGFCFSSTAAGVLILLPLRPSNKGLLGCVMICECIFSFAFSSTIAVGAFALWHARCSMFEYGFGSVECAGWVCCVFAQALPHMISLVICLSALRVDKQGEYLMPARGRLNQLWLGVRTCYIGGGVAMGLGVACMMVLEAGLRTYIDAYSYLWCSFVWVCTGAVCTSSRRGRLLAFLGRIGTDGEVEAAAMIASAVGTHGIEKTLDLAKRTFHGLPIEALEPDDLATNQGSALYTMTKKVRFGEVDAFISHSWSDSGDLKWSALQRWRSRFAFSNGRQPIVWLDKACINQNNVTNSLACLPVFLAGCAQLVVLVGPTYPRRLWCCIELFTFLRMGGELERIIVIPIDANGSTETVSESIMQEFKTFDAKKAMCFYEKDRQHLLSVIEAGFGNFDVFNEIVRHALVARCTNSLTSRNNSIESFASSVAGEKSSWDDDAHPRPDDDEGHENGSSDQLSV
mmetsp:Transcript_115241/g.325651  ORF Transcript_115241/g.325651 Transcript_115241/m.325651 type:complete len:526 (+) Transcript_115241:104-1681(+)|eukprot:CAMPEP_0117491340 /NCGR_PEP_ID=MMETSP0784-20121206/18015_1 /TAXON_ID=39447 /ORGANISM="" /LENGTH=525 /DNA_ID=CAMNT_0005286125 /DNA_START=104 /DNA_END=1681 /DNA_ORIENTATION=-